MKPQLSAKAVDAAERQKRRLSGFQHRQTKRGGSSHSLRDRMGEWQIRVNDVAESTFVKSFMAIIILLNAMQVIYESDISSACSYDKDQSACDQESGWLKIMNWFYLIVYSIELSFRIFVHRLGCFFNRWDMFDACIILVGVMSEAFGGVLPSTGILRLARLARIAKAVRVISLPPELHIMIHGFASALKAITMGSILVFGMLMLWAVVAIELLNKLNHEDGMLAFYVDQGCARCPRAWASVWDSVFSFTQLMIMGDSWDLLAIPMIDRHPATLLLFLLVFFTVVVGMTNLILAVIVDKALSAHDDNLKREAEAKERDKDTAIDQFLDMCKEMDVDGDGSLSYKELSRGFETMPSFRHALDLMDIGHKDLEVLFHLMDKDESGDVSYYEFAEELANVRSARVQTMMYFTQHQVQEVRTMVQEIVTAVLPAEQVRLLALRSSLLSSKLLPDLGVEPNPSGMDLNCDAAGSLGKDGSDCASSASSNKVEASSFGKAVAVEQGRVVQPCDGGDLDELLKTLRRQANAVLDQARSIADSASNGVVMAAALRQNNINSVTNVFTTINAENVFHNNSVTTQAVSSDCSSATRQRSEAAAHNALTARPGADAADKGKTFRHQEAEDVYLTEAVGIFVSREPGKTSGPIGQL